jgi:hypothetical protein
MPKGYVEVVRRRRLKQKFYARFIADNGKILGHTEGYSNEADVKHMLTKYFPAWDVKNIDRP